MIEAKVPPLCVLGMHRSNTSMVTRILYIFGGDLGGAENDLRHHEDNQEGYWENWEIVALNDALLAEFGGSWKDLPRLEPGWSKDSRFDAYRERAQGILAKFDPDKQWVFKDPRTMVTLEFWQGLLPTMGFLFCVRNPVEVAYSLHNRKEDPLPIEDALNLWTAYHEASFGSVDLAQCTVTNSLSYAYDALGETRRLAALMAIPPSEEKIQEAAATIRRDLFRNTTAQALVDRDVLPQRVREVYAKLGSHSGDVYQRACEDVAFQRNLSDNSLARLHVQVTQLSVRAKKAEEDLLEARNRLENQGNELEHAKRTLEAGQAHAASVQQYAEEISAELRARNDEVHALKVELNETVGAKDAAIAGLQARLDDAEAFRSAVQRTLFWRSRSAIRRILGKG